MKSTQTKIPIQKKLDPVVSQLSHQIESKEEWKSISRVKSENEWKSLIHEIVTKEMILLEKIPKNKFHDRVLRMANRYQDVTLEFKRLQMLAGNSWQRLMGHCHGWIDLKQGHKSGFDLMTVIESPDEKIQELKNRYNTLNSKSKANIIDGFAKYQKLNPKCETILAWVNATTKKVRVQKYMTKVSHTVF